MFLKRLLGAGLSEVSMGSLKYPHVFDPLDLEIIDRVYEARMGAWKLETHSAMSTVTANGAKHYANL